LQQNGGERESDKSRTSVTEPMAAQAHTPHISGPFPNQDGNLLRRQKASVIPKIKKIARSWGRMLSKDFHAYLTPLWFFSRLLKNEAAIAKRPPHKKRSSKSPPFFRR
jgi:hypothetical protein